MLEREKVGRPMLLTIGMYVAPAFGGLFLLIVLAAALGAGDYTIDGEAVTGLEFLRRAGVFYAALGGSALAAAYAIWQERSWSRWAIAGFWVVQIAGAVGEAGIKGAAGAVAAMLLALIVVGWYLFDKDNVVAYYRGLEKSEAAAELRRAQSRQNADPRESRT